MVNIQIWISSKTTDGAATAVSGKMDQINCISSPSTSTKALEIPVIWSFLQEDRFLAGLHHCQTTQNVSPVHVRVGFNLHNGLKPH